MVELTEPAIDSVIPIELPKLQRLSPWGIYIYQVSRDSLLKKGVTVPQIRDSSVFRDGLRYDSKGIVLPIGWSELEVEPGDFTEFEMMVQTLTGQFLMGRSGDQPTDAVFRTNPAALSSEQKATFESDVGLTADAVITAVAHTPPDILNQA